MSTSDEESSADDANEPVINSSEEENYDNSEETYNEGDNHTEDDNTEYNDEDDINAFNDNENEEIPVIVGNRPRPPVSESREPTRTTVRRDNKLVDALSTPRMTLYNLRSAWSKWGNIAEDMEIRDTDLSFYTEVWEQLENKSHQKAIESILELKGIKYISTPRPGERRGGGTALACSKQGGCDFCGNTSRKK